MPDIRLQIGAATPFVSTLTPQQLSRVVDALMTNRRIIPADNAALVRQLGNEMVRAWKSEAIAFERQQTSIPDIPSTEA